MSVPSERSFMRALSMDINCDMGEGLPNDKALMPYISSANIACGYHAGDEKTMLRTLELCLKFGVAAGAHPGFDDKPNFGRIPVQLTDEDLRTLIWKQLEHMQNCCRKTGATLHHVKPHGALYNMAAKSRTMSHIIAKAIQDFNASLILYGLSGSFLIAEAKEFGLITAAEAFADRTYLSDGSLTPRTDSRALISTASECVQQVMKLVNDQRVSTIDHTEISVQAETVCLHGDGPHALEFAQAVSNSLTASGISIKTVS